MDKAYLFIYDDNVGSRDVLKNTLDSMKNVKTWRYDIPYCFYVISEATAEQLYKEFIEKNSIKGRFMFIEASPNRQGQMLKDTWYLLTHKMHKPKNQ